MIIDLKKELKHIGFGLLFLCLLYTIIVYFKLGFVGILLLLTGVNLLFSIYSKITKNIDLDFKKLGKNFIYLFILLGLLRILNNYFGLFGYILGLALLSASLLYKRRKQYFKAKHYIETILFGKPLKDYIKEGKKPPKPFNY